MNRLIKVILGLAALSVLLLGLSLVGPAPPLATLPNPNGYDDFVRAGQMVAGSSDYRALSTEELRTFVSSNSAALRLVREGLKRECQVPPHFSIKDIDLHMPKLASFKSLALALSAEGKLAEMEGRTNDAARIYLETIHFSQEFPRGGVMIEKMVGLAGEGIGYKPFLQLVGHLDAKQCLGAIRILDAIDEKSESAEDVLHQEKVWVRRAFSWQERLTGFIAFKSMQSAKQSFIKKTNDTDHQRRLLMLDLAARAFELETEHRPGGYADLVPAYLKAIPLDPHTGTNLLYDFK